MQRSYLVAHDYRSSGGEFVAGTTVEIDVDLADWVNRDSPGTLVDDVPEPAPAVEVERAIVEPERNREARAPRNRSR